MIRVHSSLALFVCAVLSLALLSPATLYAGDGSRASVKASLGASEGLAMVTAGILAVPAGSVVFTIHAISDTADGTLLELSRDGDSDAESKAGKTASQTARVSILLIGGGLSKTGLAVGQSVKAVAQSTGTVLMTSAQVLAFIPNELGKALLHHSQP